MDEELDRSTIAKLTAQITAAYVANHPVFLSDMASLIGSIVVSLQRLGHDPAEETSAPHQPAVPVRRSIRPDHLVCLLCGKKLTMLKRHLTHWHDTTPEAYRAQFELKPDYPMVAPDYAATRSELAKQFGLGRKPAATRGKPSSARRPGGPRVAAARGSTRREPEGS